MHAAKKNSGNVEKILCPCLDCRNLTHHYVDIVVEHLIIRGMDPLYKCSKWYSHGEQINVAKKVKLDDTYELLQAIHFEDEEFVNHTFFSHNKNDDDAQNEQMIFLKFGRCGNSTIP